LNLQVNI